MVNALDVPLQFRGPCSPTTLLSRGAAPEAGTNLDEEVFQNPSRRQIGPVPFHFCPPPPLFRIPHHCSPSQCKALDGHWPPFWSLLSSRSPTDKAFTLSERVGDASP